MAENNTPPVKTGFPNAEKHNREVAEKLVNQDRNPLDIDTREATDALDQLAKTKTKSPEDPAAVEAAAAAKEVADKAAAAKENAPVLDDAAKKAEDEKLAKQAEIDKASKEASEKYFKDTPGLPPGASPKSSEAFSAIKIKAAQEISAREAELEKLRKEKAELEKKVSNPVPPEALKELEDHRQWRAKLDVEADPKFKEYDKKVASAQEFIYAQLSKHSSVITPEVIAEIKKHGGPENVNMTKILDAVKDPSTARLIESKLAEIETTKYDKTKAIEGVKQNLTQYVAEREKAFKASANQHTEITKQHLNPLLSNLEWLKEKPVDAKAADADKKAAEEHNAFITQTKQQLADALADDSPQMRSILLTGMAQLFHLQREHESVKKQLAAKETELNEISEKYNKVKNSSTTRLRESGAPTTPNALPKPSTDVTVRTGDALDAIAKQVMEKRAAVA